MRGQVALFFAGLAIFKVAFLCQTSPIVCQYPRFTYFWGPYRAIKIAVNKVDQVVQFKYKHAVARKVAWLKMCKRLL